MKKKTTLDTLLTLVNNLSTKEQAVLTDKIMEMLAETKTSKNGSSRDLVVEARPEVPDCPHCAAKASLGYIIKRGMSQGSQRYSCKVCDRYFVPTTNTAFERSRKSADTWRKFIKMTISGNSLHECASECSIAYQTAFTWRHKVLNAFRVHQSSTVMSGHVEMDEMLIPLSYKGNHVKGSFGEHRVKRSDEDSSLPRKAFKRGSDNKSLSSKNKACVVCLVEGGNKAFFGVVPGTGYMQPNMLDAVVGKHVKKESALILVDQYRVTLNYLEDNNYKYLKLASNTSENHSDHKPEIIGEFHLQHVNALHRHIRRFLAGYCGVSSKYLENYISLFMWLKNMKMQKLSKKLETTSINRLAMADCYISRKALEARPAVPQCA